MLLYGLHAGTVGRIVGAGGNGTGECGADAAAAIIGVAVPGVIDAVRRDWAGVRTVVQASAVASTSTRRRVQANGAGQNVPNIVFRQAISETSQPLHWVRSPDT